MTLHYSRLNNNKDRRRFWESLAAATNGAGLQRALASIDPTSAMVLRWYYTQGKSFTEITMLLNRSMSIVRNHHNRGIFQLQQYIIKKQVPT